MDLTHPHNLMVGAASLRRHTEAMSPAMQGHPRHTGYSEEFRQTVVHWRRPWQPTPVFLSREPQNSVKRQKDMTPEDEAPGRKVSNMLLG